MSGLKPLSQMCLIMVLYKGVHNMRLGVLTHCAEQSRLWPDLTREKYKVQLYHITSYDSISLLSPFEGCAAKAFCDCLQ